MKIVILKESLCIGGTERSTANISRALAKNNDVTLILYDGSDIQYPYAGTLIDLHCPAKKSILAKVLNNIVRELRYASLIKKISPDILFEFLYIGNPLSRVRRKDQIRVISARDYSLLSTMTDRFHACLSAADGMVCNSRRLREYYVNVHPEDREKVFFVPNIIEPDQIALEAREEPEAACLSFLQTHRYNLVSTGRFCKEKGYEYLLQVLAMLKDDDCDVGLILIGDGDYKERYLKLIDELGLEKDVYFTGFQKNPYKYMAKCDCFVMSSLNEGFPNVLVEAMSLSIPVVSVNCISGPAELIRKDADYNAVKEHSAVCDYGILTPAFAEGEDNSQSFAEMAHAIQMILTHPEQRSALAAAAKQRSLDFCEDAAAEELACIFRTLIERKRGQHGV
ncbi:MAG: glycosyltransferase [Clostridia bacterium]|nr:glycosyltransferase [Clostridia bacterium]